MVKKNSPLTKKIGSVIAASLAVFGITSDATEFQPDLNQLSTKNSVELMSNKQLKPQLMLTLNSSNPDGSLSYKLTSHTSHSSHSSHSSHRSHSSHYSSSMA